MKRTTTVLSLAGALAVGVAGGVYLGSLGVGASAPAAAQAGSQQRQPQAETGADTGAEEPVTPARVNAAGLTYGVLEPASMEAFLNGRGELPDLLLVVGDSGKEGYVQRAVLVPDPESLPQSPEEAVEYTLTQQRGDSVAPVYASDGVTQIDTFTQGQTD